MARRWWVTILLFVLFLPVQSCKKKHHVVNRGFYYWKTIYNPTQFETTTLQNLRVQTMYIRLFDVDAANSHIYPVAPVRLPASPDSAFRYTPAIFITQRALLALTPTNISSVAASISNMAAGICAGGNITPSEVQIDCDWTSSTRARYFELLRALKNNDFFKGKLLSCTIRMHQIKYTTSSGIPPVDKGLLMCYNMGNMKKPGNHNSILERDVAESYLSGIGSYPLRLDIALPVFSWSLLFHGQQFGRILRDVPKDLLEGNQLFGKRNERLYQCLADTVWMGYHLSPTDVIRVEDCDRQTLESVAAYTAKRVNNDSINVVFFSCDSITLSKHSLNELETIYDRYR